jgi:hypothetical protein
MRTGGPRKTHVLSPDVWFIINLHRESFFVLHLQAIMSRWGVFQIKEKERIKIPLLGKAVP